MNHISPKVLLLLLLPMMVVGSWIACVFYSSEMLHVAVGLTALMIVGAPLVLQKRIDWFSPWTFVVVSIGIGCAARGACMSFMWPDAYDIDYYFLLGEDVPFFIAPYCYLLLGLVCLTLGYVSHTPPEGQGVLYSRNLCWNVPRLNLVLALATLIAVIATIQYVRNTGGWNSGVLSGKRTVIYDIDVRGDADFNQYGQLRQLAKLANAAYLVVLGYTLFYVRSISIGRAVLLGALLVIACALPFYSSSRLPIMWTFVGSGALLWYSGREVRLGRLLVIGSVGAAVFIGMALIRGKSDVREHLSRNSIAASIIDGLVIHRNFLGLAKTAHIIHAVPKTLEYKYGETIGVWALSPIPRRVWPKKPMVHMGPMIGYRVFGNNVSGIPPGMIAELYWNFHVVGIVVGSFLLGALLRWCGTFFQPRAGQDLPLTLIYVTGPMRLGFEMAGNSIGFAVMKVVVDSASMVLILLFVLDYRTVRQVRQVDRDAASRSLPRAA